ncbi:AMP-binding protein [Tenacibaculum geojense]|uniref:AMP-binding protein n=1 Tax=Tenacibaculum geojense TaxID=915352 RepID=A0ABW3JS96_9FLAO
MKKPFHKAFKLNGKSFTTVEEVLFLAKETSADVYQFLLHWFSDDPFVTVQTSGSTGAPKEIKIKKEFMMNSAKATGAFFSLENGCKALLCLSADYIAGKMMLIRALVLGWDLYVVPTSSNPLNEVKGEFDFAAMVPLQLQNSLSQIYRIKKLIVGGGVVSNTLINQIQNFNTQIFATYGMTETVTHIAVKKLNNNHVIPAYYEVLPNVTIFKDVRNCLVIDAPKVSDELVVTNDVVQLISDKQFEWLGRLDNVINSGGVKLHPEKIEEKLSEIIPFRFFVTGIKDEYLGEKLILIIEGDLNEIDKEKLKKIVLKSSKLSKFEKPKLFYFLDSFIETGTKKIQRAKTLDLLKL